MALFFSMKLEDEISQKSFKSEAQKLLINLSFTEAWVQGQVKKHFAAFGLTSQQFNVLRILRGQKGKAIPVLEIRSRMVDRMSDASRIVDRLEKKELVCRSRCTEDGRRMLIDITDKGLKILADLDQKTQVLHDICSNLNKKEQVLLNNLLDKLRD